MMQQPPQQQQQQQQPPPAASPCASASQHRSNHAKEHLTGSETTPHTGCGTTPHTGSGITAHTGSGTTPCTHGGQQTSLKAAGRRTAPGAQHDGTAAREAAIVGSAQLNSTADNTMEEAAVAEALQLSACKRQLEELAAARPTGVQSRLVEPKMLLFLSGPRCIFSSYSPEAATTIMHSGYAALCALLHPLVKDAIWRKSRVRKLRV
eukprot:1138859-Pelagomonas_calceolata.AAC.7